jgi:hypothetical protein
LRRELRERPHDTLGVIAPQLPEPRHDLVDQSVLQARIHSVAKIMGQVDVVGCVQNYQSVSRGISEPLRKVLSLRHPFESFSAPPGRSLQCGMPFSWPGSVRKFRSHVSHLRLIHGTVCKVPHCKTVLASF